MDVKEYLRHSPFAAALRLEKILPRKTAHVLFVMFGLAALGLLIIAVLRLSEGFLSGAGISFSFCLFFLIYSLFAAYLQAPRAFTIDEVKQAWHDGLYGKGMTFLTAQILAKTAQGENLLIRDFFLALSKRRDFEWMLRRLGIDRRDFAKKSASTFSKEAAAALGQVLGLAWQEAFSGNHLHIRYPDLVSALYKLDRGFAGLMFAYDVEEEDLRQVSYWLRRRQKKRADEGKFWHRHNLLNIKGLGKGWSGGYTIHLDDVATDLTESVKFNPAPEHLYGHRNQAELLERMLVRAAGSANVVVVGNPGVGRHTLVRAFCARVNFGQTFGPLRFMRVLQIDSGAVLAGTNSLSQVIDKIQTLFGEAYLAEDVILVVNNIDAFLDPRPEAGRVNATEALLKFFRSRLRIIGITTPVGYQNTIGKNPELQSLFGKLEVAETSPAQTLLILQDEVGRLEGRTGLFFRNAALKEIAKLAAKLIQNLPNPEKSLKILEETAVYVATSTPDRVVTAAHVQKVVSTRTKVPVEQVEGQEKEKLLNMEQILQERIVGQHEAISELANALRRARSGIRSEKRPIGSFLFLGPTGVGKTETTKALANVYFGSDKQMTRFDMSEFQEIHGINRLIGDTDTNTGGLLTEAVITNPFSLILFDELEKAHPRILDLFLQVLDEGRLTDALGRTVSFTNTIIIATSNAGAELIRQMVRAGKNPAEAQEEVLDYLQKQGIFRPEFLNRFDAVIIFRPLSEGELREVATLLLRELNSRLKEKDIQVNITPELAEAVARGGFSPEFGARPLRRFIQEHIENYVAKGLLAGEISRGQTVQVDAASLQSDIKV